MRGTNRYALKVNMEIECISLKKEFFNASNRLNKVLRI